MSSRKEEKERLRREREEAERRAQAGEGTRKRLAIALGAVLAVAAVVIVVLAVTGGDDQPEVGGDAPQNVSVPPQQTDDLEEAVEAAGCVYEEFPDEGNKHLGSQDATFDDYKTNPPTSGTHRPPPAAVDGVYVPGRSPDKESWVHTLEHGRVILQYAPGTPEQRRAQLEVVMNEELDGREPGYKTVVMENNTDMPFAVAAVAWRRYVACEEFTDAAFDALRAFRAENVENSLAPEAEFPWPFTGT